MKLSDSLNKIRETFGIIDPITKEQYKDVIHSFLLAKRITVEDIKNGYIFIDKNKRDYESIYKLQCDSKVRRTIRNTGECACLISFQTRTDFGKIAFARVFEIERISLKNSKEGN